MIADTDAPNGRGKIGYREAVSIIQHKPKEAAIYADRYIRENMKEMSLGMSEASLQRNYEKVELSSSVDRGVVDRLDKEAKPQITHDVAQKADGIENRIEGKIQETSNTYDVAKEKMTKQSSEMEAQYHQEKEKVGIVEAGLQGLSAVSSGVVKAAEAIDKGVRYVEEHPEAMLTPSLLINHPDTLPPVGAKNRENRVEDKIQETGHAHETAKTKMPAPSSVLEAPYPQEKEKGSIVETERHGTDAMGGGVVKPVAVAEQGRGAHYGAKHPEVMLTPSLLVNHPDTLPLGGIKNRERPSDSTVNAPMPELPGKVVKVKHVLKAPEVESIDPFPRPKKDTSLKES